MTRFCVPTYSDETLISRLVRQDLDALRRRLIQELGDLTLGQQVKHETESVVSELLQVGERGVTPGGQLRRQTVEGCQMLSLLGDRLVQDNGLLGRLPCAGGRC